MSAISGVKRDESDEDNETPAVVLRNQNNKVPSNASEATSPSSACSSSQPSTLFSSINHGLLQDQESSDKVLISKKVTLGRLDRYPLLIFLLRGGCIKLVNIIFSIKP